MKSSRVDGAEGGAIVRCMTHDPPPSQRQTMIDLYHVLNRDEAAVCEAYAKAERLGRVVRESNDYSIPAERYAKALWRDGIAKGWLR